jgi:predicted amidohydrolase
MAKTAKRLFGPAQLSGAAATKYTVPAGTKAIVRHVHLFNASGAPVTVTVSLGADAAGTRLFDAFSVPSGQPFDWYPYQVMEAAEVIQAFASVANVVVMAVFGDELTLG